MNKVYTPSVLVCIYVYMYICIYQCIYVYMYICTVYMYICIHAYMHICIYAYMRIGVHVYICIYVCIYISIICPNGIFAVWYNFFYLIDFNYGLSFPIRCSKLSMTQGRMFSARKELRAPSLSVCACSVVN